MKTLPTLPFLFFFLLLFQMACVPEHQALDIPYEGSNANFVVNKSQTGLSAFFETESAQIIGFIASTSRPVKIRVYDRDGHFIFGENLKGEDTQTDFSIDFRRNQSGQYQIRVGLENGDLLEEWISVQKG